jgi:hypothetical protein
MNTVQTGLRGQIHDLTNSEAVEAVIAEQKSPRDTTYAQLFAAEWYYNQPQPEQHFDRAYVLITLVMRGSLAAWNADVVSDQEHGAIYMIATLQFISLMVRHDNANRDLALRDWELLLCLFPLKRLNLIAGQYPTVAEEARAQLGFKTLFNG